MCGCVHASADLLTRMQAVNTHTDKPRVSLCLTIEVQNRLAKKSARLKMALHRSQQDEHALGAEARRQGK